MTLLVLLAAILTKRFVMTHPDTQHRLHAYSLGAIWLHWLIALAILAQLGIGFIMVHWAGIADQTRFLIFQWHKTIGILVLLLSIIRIGWRLVNKPPAKAPMLYLEKVAAQIVTFLFYVLMLAVPVTGWLVVSASPTGIPTLLFLVRGLVWPDLPVAPDAALETMVGNIHAFLAYSFVLLLFLHIAGALKHSLFDGVAEMSRMLPTQGLPHQRAKKASAGLALLLFLVLGLGGLLLGHFQTGTHMVAGRQAAQSNDSLSDIASPFTTNWVVDHQKSSLTYKLDFSGVTQNGRAESWRAFVYFDPAQPDTAKAQVVINAASIRYDDSFISDSVGEEDGLDVATYPQILIMLDSFVPRQTDWLATGTITIRGITRPVSLPFTFTEQDNRAYVSGSAVIERLLFDIGKESDPDCGWLDNKIHIKVTLEAEKK